MKQNDWVDMSSKTPPFDDMTMSYTVDVLFTDCKEQWVGFYDCEKNEFWGHPTKKNRRATHWKLLDKMPNE